MAIDPEYQRYKRNYPSFPGVQACVDLLHQSNVQGAYLDALVADLEAHAVEHSDELIAAFQTKADMRVQSLLLAALAQARTHDAFRIFVEHLTGPDENLRTWAAYGLYRLDTKEARRALWQAQSHHFPDSEETTRFQQMLVNIKGWI